MTTIPYGKLATAIRDESHDFFHEEKLMFLEYDSEVNVNSKARFYVFKSLERDLMQTLTTGEFKWTE